MTRPVNKFPSMGVFRERECMSSRLKVYSSLGRSITNSAGEPGCTRGGASAGISGSFRKYLLGRGHQR